jgi:hypothetical protein
MKTCIRAVEVVGLFLAGCGLAGAVSAQDSRLASQSLHCAVWMDVLGSAWSDGQAQAQRFQRGANILLDVHAKASEARVDGAHVEALKHALQEKLRKPDPQQVAALREEAIVCGAWVEGFLTQGEAYRYVPVYPKVVAISVRSQYGALVDKVLQTAAQ